MHPSIIIAALKGGSGKTILSLGLVSAWREKGFRIAPFKKGPDFIDAGWLAFAADRACYNLDPFLMTENEVIHSFLLRSKQSDLSLIEGNRGLYDGLDLDGCCSTAELAKHLKTPVLIVLDVTMATRTMAAVIKGCQAFDPDLNIAGVVLNRVAGSRQEGLITGAIEKYCGLPVVGSVPKLKENLFPERHMGLVPFQERDHAEKAISWAKKTVQENLQLDEIWRIACGSQQIEELPQDPGLGANLIFTHQPLRIGFIKDKAFWFYYPENLEQLEQLGAVLIEIDAISSPELPSLDALYIGGGFPETQAEALAENRNFRDSVKAAIEGGLPVYAECGGFMYLGERLLVGDRYYPMVGALPVDFILQKKPQGHGYTVLEVSGPNPYYSVGETLRGHEFHYSKPVFTGDEHLDFVFKVGRGHGFDGERDGVCKKNLLATYTHVHAAGNPDWSRNFYRAALNHKKV
ncbi:MAG: cobyrinate a,c-diamide synthase [Pseudomonadota bacterium]|nr:cobyrinate a,c-diamide synthase [Desulfobacterales bacterium]MBL7101435.1 cobyrinate a,c-diamide synthase [Desulfobacteraceae bacterium]MBL7171766.1 cobyrinate a,c-diamide synthase [Desulfobacteraceae bacterium]MBU0990829.1 cobyrinate a,c-diamide synthase [Pseudomonadota bacterium]